MLFNSLVFIYAFVPIFLLGFFVFGKLPRKNTQIVWLVCASFFFYAFWRWQYVFCISASILVNYLAAIYIIKYAATKRGWWITAFGIAFNLCFIGYYKYVDFFIGNINSIFGLNLGLLRVLLPLGISFFTFQQIAFLVDAYKGLVKDNSFLRYVLFVVYFPPLIAGPIIHHKEIMPQFDRLGPLRHKNLAIGVIIFSVGLVKKVIFADYFSEIANPIYNNLALVGNINFMEAWDASLAYTLQIYFDFSGYCDMAMGISLMIGITLPLNFNSPYKSASIIEFWRRWHMTLSRFLRDYLYISLGGNRKGKIRRYANLIITMLIGGLWHGASWTFVVWGAMHGVCLAANHAWHAFLRFVKLEFLQNCRIYKIFFTLLTFLFVAFAWVLFRANTFQDALVIMQGMFTPSSGIAENRYIDAHSILPFKINLGLYFHHFLMLAALCICFFFKNSNEITDKLRTLSENSKALNFLAGFAVFVILFCSIVLIGRSGSSDFIYFNF